MFKKMRILELIVNHCMDVKPGQHVFIITDDYARSLKISQQVAELCGQRGAEAVIAIMEPRTHAGHEPPQTIAEAMQMASSIFHIGETYTISHTDAAKKAREKGIKYFVTLGHLSEDYFEREISIEDLYRMKERSERLASIESRADTARVTSSFGTDIKMSIKDRPGIPLYPLSGSVIALVPDYAEAAIAPLEGSSEGTIMVDGSVQGWNFLLREPIKLSVHKGRVTEISGPEIYLERFKKILGKDENASNCAAELGIGTSHTIPADLKGWTWDYGVAGTIHLAMGRNNDIGGQTYSQIHNDLLITNATVWLDDLCVVENGELKV